VFDLETLRSRLRLDASGFTSGLSGASRSLSGFSQRVASAGRGILDMGSKLGLTVLGLRELAGVAKDAFNALFGGNIAIENVRAQLRAFTGSAEEAEKVLVQIRQEAAKTPFGFNEMASATASLVPAAKQSGVALMDLVKQAEILAAVNPAEGLEGAAFALREALSGDFTSIIERFNLPRQRLNQLKEQGVPALEAVQIALKEMGIDASIVSNMANTATGRWSTFIDTLNTIKDTAMRRVFELLSGALVPMQAWLDANNERLTAFAELAGERLANALIRLARWMRENRDELLRLARTALTSVVTGFRIFRSLLEFVLRHASTMAPIVVGLVGSFLLFYKIIPAVQGLITVIKALRVALFTMNPWFLIIAAAVALLYLAWTKNWFGIRDKTAAVLAYLRPKIEAIAAWLAPVAAAVVQFGKYIVAVFRGDVQPAGKVLEQFPAWARPAILVIGRLAKTVRVLVMAFRQGGIRGLMAALQKQIRAFGRAWAGLVEQITGSAAAAKIVRQFFNEFSHLVGNVVSLVDNLVHGRWRAALGDLWGIAKNAVMMLFLQWKYVGTLAREAFERIPWGTIAKAVGKGIIGIGRWIVTQGVPWLIRAGARLFAGLLTAAVGVFTDHIVPWIKKNGIDLITGAIRGAWNLLFNAGNYLIGGLGAGISFAWNWLMGWVSGLPGKIVDAFGAWWNNLFNAGYTLIGALASGISAAWNWLIGWLQDRYNDLPSWMRGVIGKAAEGLSTTLGVAAEGVGTATTNLSGNSMSLAAAGGGGLRTIQNTFHIDGAQDPNAVAAAVLAAIRRAEEGEF
jgi:hypothetical protein